MRFFLVAILIPFGCSALRADEAEDSVEIRLGEAKTHHYQVGLVVKAVGGDCKGIVGTMAVPTDWPEQQVRIDEEDLTNQVRRVRYETIDDAVKQMVVEIPLLRSGEQAHALVTFEVTTQSIEGPKDTAELRVPGRVEAKLRLYLQPSPYIESDDRTIRELAEGVVAEERPDWQRVEAIYDVVREKVAYEKGPLKGARQALDDGRGDCEELSSLFIAMCRAAGVPARTVWIDGHCYPEFYLVDGAGGGRWFPCQAAGTRAFGEMPASQPILQKGDNFSVPKRFRAPPKFEARVRYVGERVLYLPARGSGIPQVQFVRKVVE